MLLKSLCKNIKKKKTNKFEELVLTFVFDFDRFLWQMCSHYVCLNSVYFIKFQARAAVVPSCGNNRQPIPVKHFLNQPELHCCNIYWLIKLESESFVRKRNVLFMSFAIKTNQSPAIHKKHKARNFFSTSSSGSSLSLMVSDIGERKFATAEKKKPTQDH